MSMEAQRAWVESRFQAQMRTAHPSVPIRFENVSFRQPTGAFVALFLLEGSSFQVEIGSPAVDRHVGIVQVDVLVTPETGTSLANTLAEFAGNSFVRQRATLPDGSVVRFRTPSYAHLGMQAGRYRVVCSIPYWRDEPRR